MMEVMQMLKTKSSTYESSEDGPIDLTKHKKSVDSPFPTSPDSWNSSIYKLYPHLRFGAEALLQSNPTEPSHSTSTNFHGKTNGETRVQQFASVCAALPKKRRYDEINGDDIPEAKRKKIPLEKTAEASIADSLAFENSKLLNLKDLYNQSAINSLRYSSPNVPFYRSSLGENGDFLETLGKRSVFAPNPPIKETENLMAAVHHSQMLYYTYCTQLYRSLQTKQLLQDQERYSKIHPNMADESWSFSFENALNQARLPTGASLHNVEKEVKLNSTINRVNPGPHSTRQPSVSPARSVSSPPQPSSTSEERNIGPDGEGGMLLGRKRAPRALTGKHVRPGTGASPSILLTLRQKLASKGRQGQDITARHRKSYHTKLTKSTRGKRK